MIKKKTSDRKRSRRLRSTGLVRRAGFDGKLLRRAKIRWTVYHPDGVELGLLPVTFTSEMMARQTAALWNKKYRGHRVLAPNDKLTDSRRRQR